MHNYENYRREMKQRGRRLYWRYYKELLVTGLQGVAIACIAWAFAVVYLTAF